MGDAGVGEAMEFMESISQEKPNGSLGVWPLFTLPSPFQFLLLR